MLFIAHTYKIVTYVLCKYEKNVYTHKGISLMKKPLVFNRGVRKKEKWRKSGIDKNFTIVRVLSPKALRFRIYIFLMW